MKYLLLLFFLISLTACRQGSKTQSEIHSPLVVDPHSFAEPQKAAVKHLDLDVKVDFNTKILSGKAVWAIENVSKGDEIVFDTRGLDIEKVTLDGETEEAMFALGDEEQYLGQPLSIQIKPETEKIYIWYRTSADAAALQWLEPQQTAGKKYPFLFTQSQAVLARSWVPCQDSPGVRFTYNAQVSVPKGLLALMSAQNPQQKTADGIYQFKQSHPIPSYLMALAVGDIDFKAVDGRTGVYAEPSVLAKAVWEFADMGKMVNAAEKLYGKYRWGRYDLLVLPPSFPFGGMENPMLTFATPTVIAGDRSLVNLVAHELAHSWSGNLATNATWNDFWLNEGFTTYFERRIIEEVYGKEEAKMQEVLSGQSLKKTVEELGNENPDTRLKLDLKGRDPDEGVSDIAYDKGFFFLRAIEEAVGREKLDKFLKSYFEDHAFQSVTTEQFLRYMDQNLIKGDQALIGKIKADEWVYGTGIPENAPVPQAEILDVIDTVSAGLKDNSEVKGLSQKIKTTNEKLYFLNSLPKDLTLDQMKALDDEFSFTASGNAEVQAAWFVIAIRNQYEPAYPAVKTFLIHVGRRKFLMPLYGAMVETPAGKKMAEQIYAEARPNYHSVTVNSIDELMK